MISRSTLGAALVGLLAAACGGDDQPPPATPAPSATVVAPPPVDTSAVDAAAPPAKVSLADKMAAAQKSVLVVGDGSEYANLFAPDAVIFTPGWSVEKQEGRDAIQKTRQMLGATNPGLALASVRIWTKGNTMVQEWAATGTDKETSKPFSLHGLDIYTFNDDGLIATDHSYWDVVEVMKQIGVYKGDNPAHPVFTLPTAAPEMHVAKNDDTEAKNAATVVALNAAWTKGDDKTYFAGLSDDSIGYDEDTQKSHSKKEIMAGVAAYRKAVEVTACHDTNTIAVEDVTIDESELSMTQKAAFSFGKTHIANTKKSATTHGVEIDWWKDGKIVKSMNFGNEMELDKQLGIGAAAPKKADKAGKPGAKAAASH